MLHGAAAEVAVGTRLFFARTLGLPESEMARYKLCPQVLQNAAPGCLVVQEIRDLRGRFDRLYLLHVIQKLPRAPLTVGNGLDRYQLPLLLQEPL